MPLTTDAWVDVSPALTTGSWIAAVPSIGSVTVETALPTTVDDVRAQSTQLMGDGITATTVAPAGDADRIVTTEMTRSSESRAVFRLSLGGPVAGARARVRPAGRREAITVVLASSCAATLQTRIRGRRVENGLRIGGGPTVRAGEIRTETRPGASGARRPARHCYCRWLADSPTMWRSNLPSEDDARIAAVFNGEPAGHCDLRGHAGCELTLPAAAVREPVSALTLDRTGSAGRQLVLRGARITRQQENEPAARQ